MDANTGLLRTPDTRQMPSRYGCGEYHGQQEGGRGLLFKLHYPSFPTVHGKKANIIADILMPLHGINLSVARYAH